MPDWKALTLEIPRPNVGTFGALVPMPCRIRTFSISSSKEALMPMLRFFHARRMALGLTLLGSLALASGCADSNPVPTDSNAAPPEGAMTGDKMKAARLKEFGTPGDPKTTKK